MAIRKPKNLGFGTTTLRTNFTVKMIHIPIAIRKSLKFLPLALISAGGVALGSANTVNQIAASAKDAQPIEVGTDTPDADLRDLEGKEVTLQAIIAEKPTAGGQVGTGQISQGCAIFSYTFIVCCVSSAPRP
jgi:hypothetical protein